MGLKTAACWFGTTWTIRTSKLGSASEYTARVHVPGACGQSYGQHCRRVGAFRAGVPLHIYNYRGTLQANPGEELKAE